jgi:GNAT superfamily N-acetyltransferase
MKEVTLRLAEPRDLAGVDALLARSYPRLLKPDYSPSVLVTALPIIARARPELVVSGSYWLAEEAGELRAAGGWTPGAPGEDVRRGGVGHVRHVVSDPDHLRRGIARALMQAAMEQARNVGVLRLECLSALTAVPFYKALGFVEGPEVTVPLRLGIGFPAIEMQRSL